MASVQTPFEVRMFHREAKALSEAGHHVTIIAQDDHNGVFEGIRVVGIGRATSRLRRLLRTSRVFTRAWKEEADAYQVHNPELLPWGVILRISRRRPVVYDVHEDFPGAARQRAWLPGIVRRPVSLLVDLLEKLLALLVTGVVVADPQIAERFMGRWRQPVVVHNYPRLSYLKALSAMETQSRTSQTMVHAGSLSRDRGGDIMLRAFQSIIEKVPDAKLLVIADLQHDYVQRFRCRALKLGLGDSVLFVDYLPHEQVLQKISECALGLSLLQPIPKYLKNVPQKVLEYMGCGIPCVVSDLPPIHDYIAQTNAGILVDPRDVAAIADAAIYLLQNPDEAVKMGQRGRSAVFSRYNWERESEKLLALYDKLLSR